LYAHAVPYAYSNCDAYGDGNCNTYCYSNAS
jgi:hypothetical protein